MLAEKIRGLTRAHDRTSDPAARGRIRGEVYRLSGEQERRAEHVRGRDAALGAARRADAEEAKLRRSAEAKLRRGAITLALDGPNARETADALAAEAGLDLREADKRQEQATYQRGIADSLTRQIARMAPGGREGRKLARHGAEKLRRASAKDRRGA